MENNILKIDYDLERQSEMVWELAERIEYLDRLDILSKKDIRSIESVCKSKYSARILLNKELRPEYIVTLQLLLGSDWRKEAHTITDHFIRQVDYSNRMFDIKRYPGGEYKTAQLQDITQIVLLNVDLIRDGVHNTLFL